MNLKESFHDWNFTIEKIQAEEKKSLYTRKLCLPECQWRICVAYLLNANENGAKISMVYQKRIFRKFNNSATHQISRNFSTVSVLINMNGWYAMMSTACGAWISIMRPYHWWCWKPIAEYSELINFMHMHIHIDVIYHSMPYDGAMRIE